jgi:hypothetical protein
MSEQQPDASEALTDEAISRDDAPGTRADADQAVDPDLANTSPGEDRYAPRPSLEENDPQLDENPE